MSELDQYDYHLPPELIAQQPLRNRADARLMLIDRAAGTIDHRHVRDLPTILHPGDLLVINDTRVVPARLMGRRAETGGRWEGLFLGEQDGLWQIICKARGRLQTGDRVELINAEGAPDIHLRLLNKGEGGIWVVLPEHLEEMDEPWYETLQRVGRVPLPHYIRDGQMVDTDRRNYQTVYAHHPGSAAAPTAGLHFSESLLQALAQSGVKLQRVTLHVGLDTFRPVKAERLDEHKMHSEWGEISEDTVQAIQQTRAAGHRVIAIGTTSVRVLETAAADGELAPWSGTTELFIRPPYQFRAIDGLMTNFHLPRSTLLILVRTLGGDALLRQAYEEAIQQGYRFYSYGDAMLIL